MTKKLFIFLLLLTFSLNTRAFAMGEKPNNENNKGARDIVMEHIKAFDNEDIETYMDTFHDQSPEKTIKARRYIEQLFSELDTKIEIEEVSVLRKSGTDAKIRATYITRRVSGAPFADNKIIMILTLRKTNGQWKIYRSEMEKIEYLKKDILSIQYNSIDELENIFRESLLAYENVDWRTLTGEDYLRKWKNYITGEWLILDRKAEKEKKVDGVISNELKNKIIMILGELQRIAKKEGDNKLLKHWTDEKGKMQ